jgi:molecular chaperone GrpE
MRQNIHYALTPKPESPVPDEQVDNDVLNIQIDDDLLAAALASVEQIHRNATQSVRADLDVQEPSGSAEDAETTPAQTPANDEDDELEIDIDIDIDIDDLEPDEDEVTVTDDLHDAEHVRLTQLLEATQSQLQDTQSQLQDTRLDREKYARTLQKLRKEVLRLRAKSQRDRDRQEALEKQLKHIQEARNSAEAHNKQLVEASNRSAMQVKHIQDRRRQEKAEQRKYGHSGAISTILPVIDHLQMAMKHATANPADILNGVQMVLSQFESALASVGVSAIESSPGTPFNPNIHEALLHVPTDSVAENAIYEQLASGYTLNGRLLRAARVSVAAALPVPEPTESVADEAQNSADDSASAEALSSTDHDAQPEAAASEPEVASREDSDEGTEGSQRVEGADAPDAESERGVQAVALVTDEDAYRGEPSLQSVQIPDGTGESLSAPDDSAPDVVNAQEGQGHCAREE